MSQSVLFLPSASLLGERCTVLMTADCQPRVWELIRYSPHVGPYRRPQAHLLLPLGRAPTHTAPLSAVRLPESEPARSKVVRNSVVFFEQQGSRRSKPQGGAKVVLGEKIVIESVLILDRIAPQCIRDGNGWLESVFLRGRRQVMVLQSNTYSYVIVIPPAGAVNTAPDSEKALKSARSAGQTRRTADDVCSRLALPTRSGPTNASKSNN